MKRVINEKIKNMSPQTYKAFVTQNLISQMQALQNGSVKRFCAFSNTLRHADAKYGTLLQPQLIEVAFGLHGLYVKQYKKPKTIIIKNDCN